MATSEVLVTGASGYIGGKLIAALLDRGVTVRAMSRNPARAVSLRRPGVELVAGDVLDPSSVRAAMDGVRSAYYLVHSMGEYGRGFEEMDRLAATIFAAEGRDLEQIIYLGGL